MGGYSGYLYKVMDDLPIVYPNEYCLMFGNLVFAHSVSCEEIMQEYDELLKKGVGGHIRTPLLPKNNETPRQKPHVQRCPPKKRPKLMRRRSMNRPKLKVRLNHKRKRPNILEELAESYHSDDEHVTDVS